MKIRRAAVPEDREWLERYRAPEWCALLSITLGVIVESKDRQKLRKRAANLRAKAEEIEAKLKVSCVHPLSGIVMTSWSRSDTLGNLKDSGETYKCGLCSRVLIGENR